MKFNLYREVQENNLNFIFFEVGVMKENKFIDQ